jgi:hypothetical protein
VSHYQKYINWAQYATAREFAFIKCTEWADWYDDYFAYNWAEAKAAGVMRVPYHFWRNVSVEGQLSNLMTRLGTDRGEGAVMVDMEIDNCDYDSLYEFCLLLEARFHRVVIYSSVRYWKDNNPRWLRFDLFVADWTPPVSIPRPWTTYKFHQQGVSGYGEIPGISTRCDYGVFNGSREELINYLGLAQWPPQESEEDMTEINEKLDLILENQGIIIAMLDGGGGEEPPADPPAPPEEPEPPSTIGFVRVTIPRANARFEKRENANGMPIMEIYPSDNSLVSERIQFIVEATLTVIREKVRADGGEMYYELTARRGRGNETLFIRDDDCVKLW